MFKTLPKSKLKKLLRAAGVYLFYEKLTPNTKHPTPIYIGKSVNIKERVKNHFLQPSYRDNLFIEKVTKIGFIETDSEIEALILEANLIKKYQPKFNVVWRDDKNYFYVAIAKNKNKIPYVYITHQPHHETWNMKHKTKYVGPFVDGGAIKKTLKYLRKVFPFYTSAGHLKNKCTWCHLDLCPGPNPDIKKYKNDVKKLILVLQGKKKNVLNSLKKEMKQLSKESKFEEAGKIRDKILAFEQIMSHAHIINLYHKTDGRQNYSISQKWEKTNKNLQSILDIKKTIERIECYDVSNIQGKHATGSMVVFLKGTPDKNEYRKFKVKIENIPNDVAMLKEVLKRRFAHSDWPYPEVILIDGGKAQLNAAINTKNSYTLFFKALKKRVYSKIKKVRVISIAKGRQELFVEGRKNPTPLKDLPQDVYNLIKHLDDEAHRFAITYHKKLRKRELLAI